MLNLKVLLSSDRRRLWAALKSKHSKALAAKKIDFDSKLGPSLDKYQLQLAPVDKLFAQQAVTATAVEKVVAVTRPLRNIAQSYQDKVKGLGDPAEKEIVAFLKALESDCADWEKVLDVVASQAVVARNSPAQMKAVREVYGVLDALGQQLINLRRSLPDMQVRAKKIPDEAKYARYQKAAKQAVPEKEWRKVLAADMKMLESNAATLNSLAGTTEAALNRLLSGSVKFDERSDYAAFKDLARSFASSTALKDFKQRAVSLDQWMTRVIVVREDYEKGPMTIAGADMKDLRRAGIGAAEAATKLVDPVIAGIGKLP